MAEGLSVLVPRDVKGNITSVQVYVNKQRCTCPTNPALAVFIQDNIALDLGHHADRDLEYAMDIAKWFGGKVIDERPPNDADHGVKI